MPGIVEDIFKETDDLIKFIDKVSTQLTLSIKLQDPYIDQLMELKQIAWVVRNAAGDAAVAVSFALEGKPQTATAVDDYIAKVSKIRSTWAVLEDLANGLPLPASFAQARERVNRDYFGSDYIDIGMKTLKEAAAGQTPTPDCRSMDGDGNDAALAAGRGRRSGAEYGARARRKSIRERAP